MLTQYLRPPVLILILPGVTMTLMEVTHLCMACICVYVSPVSQESAVCKVENNNTLVAAAGPKVSEQRGLFSSETV